MKTLVLITIIFNGYVQTQNLSTLPKYFENGVLNIYYPMGLQEVKTVLKQKIKTEGNQCLLDLNTMIGAVLNQKMWALQMVDSSSKLQSGVLEGHIYDLGNFDECISTSSPDNVFLGKYCLLSTELPDMNHKLPRMAVSDPTKLALVRSICVPNSCKEIDITVLIKILETKLGVPTELNTKVVAGSCQSAADRPHLNTWDIITIVLAGLLLCWIFICTIVDLVFETEGSLVGQIMKCFSFYRNGQKLFRISKHPEMISCLNGLRVISIFWIVIAHRIFILTFIPLSINSKWLPIVFRSWAACLLTAGPIAVDTFLLLSGYLVTLSLLKGLTKMNGRMNWFYFYIHRYIRLTAGVVVILIFTLTISKSAGNGPIYESGLNTLILDNCKKYWWSLLLYIQNYVNPVQMCLGHTWYLSVDMQLYILSPLLLVPIWRWRNIGYSVLGVLIIAAHVSTFWVIAEYEIKVPASLMLSVTPLDMNNWNEYYYSKSHTRATPWLIGALFGYYSFNLRQMPSINKAFATVMWIISVGFMASVIFLIHGFVQEDYVYNKIWDTAYLTFSKTLWSIAICWLIFACQAGYGGVVNWFLSLEFWSPLCKISYGVYLVHILQQYLLAIDSKTEQYFSFINTVYLCVGDIFLTCFWATAIYLCLETPIFNLETMFWKGLMQRNTRTVEPEVNTQFSRQNA